MTTHRKLMIAKVRELKEKARMQAHQLSKLGFYVDFFNRYRENYAELKNNEIYNFEKIVIYEVVKGKYTKIIFDIDYFSLNRFYETVNLYAKKYGRKHLHKHTAEILAEYDDKILVL